MLVLAGCSGDETNGPAVEPVQQVSHDSAGVRIVESSGMALTTPLEWLRDTLPDWEIGDFDGEGPFIFAGVAGIQAFADGSLVIVDSGSGELRWFDAVGGHRQTGGGLGPGPVEFARPVLVPRFPQDSLLVFDRIRGTFVLVASDGTGARAVSRMGIDPDLLVGTPQVAFGTRVVYRSSSGRPALCPENSPCEVPVHVRWVDFATGEGRDLSVYTGWWLNFVDRNGQSLLLDGLLDQKGLAAAGPWGLVVEGASHHELRQFDEEGELRLIMRLAVPTQPATRQILNSHASGSPQPEETIRMFGMMALPDALPAFRSLRVDGLGWYWAELFRTDEGGTPEWLVLDAEGGARGVVTFPTGFEMTSVAADYALGLWKDPLGVEYVRRYSLVGRQ